MASTNIEHFKQETFSLIKQQSIKIKTISKDLEIKQQQIRLLKQTIQVLQDEKDEITRSNINLKAKIDTILKEVGNYNDTVVQKLWTENENIKKKLQQLAPALSQSISTVKRLTKQLQTSEQSLQKQSKQSKQSAQYLIEQRKQLENIKLQNTKQKQMLQERERKINRLQAENEQQQGKIKSHDKQIDQLVNKCQQTANSYEKKMKNLKETLIKKEQLLKLEQQFDRCKNKCQEQIKEIGRHGREKNELLLQIKMLKEKETSIATKNQVETLILEADIRNLKDSCKVSKKISEFQSKYAENFYQIIEAFQKLKQQKDQSENKLDFLQVKFDQLEKILNQKQSLIEQSKTQLDIMAEKLKSSTQSIQSSYEGKILQLSIKIKKEQRALQEIGIKDRQFTSLNEQYEKLVQQHISMKQSLENTIEQYKKQNKKLTGQVGQLIQLCDQSINTKNSLNSLKHSINNLLAVIYYLHLNLVRNRESRRKIYLPFIQFYFHSRYALEKKVDNGKGGKLKKLRSCVVVVVAIKRMQKNIGDVHSSGLVRYAQKAIKNKGKIEELSGHLQNVLEKAIKNEKNVGQLLKETKNIYKWSNVFNYQKINIPINWYIGQFSKQQL